ncbi:hypothetical protein, partial [Haemophilus parainfluenzae]|uniref:hypothetical protein n=1 Tax=Haemophilus parainfluenzae TaxID=729 RepID=UPI001CEDFA2D
MSRQYLKLERRLPHYHPASPMSLTIQSAMQSKPTLTKSVRRFSVWAGMTTSMLLTAIATGWAPLPPVQAQEPPVTGQTA